MKSYLSLSVFLMMLFLASHSQNIGETEIWLCRIGRIGNLQDFSEAKNITERKGYDNQPSFSNDSRNLYFTSMASDSQTDISRYGIESEKLIQVTQTKESEYSPTADGPDGAIIVVRVELDSTQRVWRFAATDVHPVPLFKKVKKIGYYAMMARDEAAFFILGEPHYLMYAGPRKKTIKVDTAIGRCIQKVPEEKAVTYVSKADSIKWMLKKYSPYYKRITNIVQMPEGVEDYTWTPWNTIWAFNKGTLVEWKPGSDWKAIGDFSHYGPGVFYRLAISPDGKWLSMVSIEGKLP